MITELRTLTDSEIDFVAGGHFEIEAGSGPININVAPAIAVANSVGGDAAAAAQTNTVQQIGDLNVGFNLLNIVAAIA